MPLIHYILATAGHIDHGKSELVRALTGIDPDRLPEEKARGITIELGFAHFDLPGLAATYRIGVVDVPGHEDFVKNMVAGVGSIDLALLVVAADDGWMPQTEEHLQILSYLGLTHGLVALTKIDLAASEESVRNEVRQKLAGTFLAESPIVSTSVLTGRGLEELKSAIAAELARTPAQRDIAKPRLAVDRAFTVRGAGTIVTGTLTGGPLRRGQAVVIQPTGTPARIRTVQSYNSEVEQASPGARVALNLPDLHPAGSSHGGAAVGRGDVVTLAELGRASDTIDALLEKSSRDANPRPLKEATRVRVHHGSGNFPAVIYFNGGNSLSAGEQAFVQLRFDSPVFAFAGDHFIVRDWSEQQTLAGGMVLDPDAVRRGFRHEDRLHFLRQRSQAGDPAESFVSSQLDRDGAAALSTLLLKSRFPASDITRSVESLQRQSKVLVVGNLTIAAQWWRGLLGKACAAIEQTHRDHPEQSGMRLADLRKTLEMGIEDAAVFDLLIDHLCRDGFVRAGTSVRQMAHRPALPPLLQPAGKQLRSLLAANPLEPPSRKELARDSASQQALRFLIQSGEAVEIGPELVLCAEGYQQAIAKISDHLAAHGSATVSDLRQVLNTSRRIMVPLLEKLDADAFTLRQGDKRVLKTSSRSPRSGPA